ncbi:MAG: transposase [Phycisphaerae bacterium]|nr:transposase [Phycisphaerae bacterium]
MSSSRRQYSGAEKMAILREHLLEKTPVSDVCQNHGLTPGMFYEWQKKLFEHGAMLFDPATAVAGHNRVDAKKDGRRGVRWQMLDRNPFDGIAAGGQYNEARKRFIPQADVAKVLAACPDSQWRILVGLSRFGGLRIPSEALPLTWQDVNWDTNTLLVHSPKTEHHEGQASRTIPLFPELRQVLLEAFEAAQPGTTRIITMADSAQVNWRTTLNALSAVPTLRRGPSRGIT